MKKTVNVAIGGCSFIIDEDACNVLSEYLDRFKAALEDITTSEGIMEELEGRIADQLKEKLGAREVVDVKMVNEVTGRLGYPENCRVEGNETECQSEQNVNTEERPVRKLFRDPDEKKIAGVCSGLAIFLGVDVVLIRTIFLVALICCSAGFWIYLAVWIAAPEARTAAEKCELRGIPATAENIRRFTEGR